jgi:hypothetical protein
MLLGTFSGISAPSSVAYAAGIRIQTQGPSSNRNITRIFVNPNITDTSIVNGSYVSFSVSINQTAYLSGFDIVLQYDTKILDARSFDYSSGIFAGSNAFSLKYCIDAIGTCNPEFQNLGQANLQVATLGSPLINVSGLLFIARFQVQEAKGPGLSLIHIAKGELSVNFGGPNGNGAPAILSSITKDAYFNNALCGSQLCSPLDVNVFFSAVPAPIVERPINFNATVVNPNKDALDVFTWVWGDTGLPTVTKTPNATHIYHREQQGIGQLTVTLTVTDTYGITGLGSVQITIGRIWVQLSVDRFTINPSTPVIPGTPVRVDIQVSSLYSTINATSNVSVILDNGEHGNKTLISQSYFLTPSAHANPSTYTLDTSPYGPKVYRIVANVQLQSSNSSLYLNDTSTSVATVFLQLIQPMPSNASLSLFQFGGLGLGIIIVLYAVFIVFKRFFRAKPEL